MVSIALLRRSPKGGGGHGGGGGGGGGHGSSGGGGGKGSSSSSSGSTTKGGGVVVVGGGGGGNNHHGHGGGGGSHLPLWAIFLIVYFSIFTLLFVISLVYYCRTERKNQRAGRSFRPWYAIWKSFCIASGLWIFICLIKLAREAVEKKATKRGHGGSSRPSGRAGFPVFRAGSGAYTKVDEGGGGPHNSTAYNPPGGGLTAPWPPNTPHIFGSSNNSVSSSPYEQQQRNGTGARYEPMGYSGATYAPPRPDRQQPIITGPIQQTSAIPLPRSRSPSPAPSSIMTTSDPPPYPYSEFAGGAYSRPPGGDTERLLRTPAPLPFPVPALHSPGSKH